MRTGGGPLTERALAEITDLAASVAPVQLTLEAFRQDGQLRGVDLGIEPSSPRAAETLCQAAFAAAAQHQLIAFDPQLGREVLSGDAAQIAAQLQLSQSFVEAAACSPPGPTARGLTASGRLWLIIGAAFLGLLLASRALSCTVS